jgi:hypothetical protein
VKGADLLEGLRMARLEDDIYIRIALKIGRYFGVDYIQLA